VLEQAATFYQQQLDRYPEALRYLEQRGLRDPVLIKELRIGYAPGGSLRRHLALRAILAISCNVSVCSTHKAATPSTGASSSRAAKADASSTSTAAVSLPPSPIDSFRLQGRLVRLGIGRQFSTVILVEGLFDLAVLWQVGFRHVTCSLGTHLNADQFQQLCDRPRTVYLTFDVDANGSGPTSPRSS